MVVPFLGLVVAHHQGVLGQLLEEALGAGHVDEEVERPGRRGQREEREERPHRVVGDGWGGEVGWVCEGRSTERKDGGPSSELLHLQNTVTPARPPGQAAKLPRSAKIGSTQGIGRSRATVSLHICRLPLPAATPSVALQWCVARRFFWRQLLRARQTHARTTRTRTNLDELPEIDRIASPKQCIVAPLSPEPGVAYFMHVYYLGYPILIDVD